MISRQIYETRGAFFSDIGRRWPPAQATAATMVAAVRAPVVDRVAGGRPCRACAYSVCGK